MTAHAFVWLLSLGVIILRFTPVVACLTDVSIFMAERHSAVWTYHSLFLHSPVGASFPVLSRCGQSCYEHVWASLCVHV